MSTRPSLNSVPVCPRRLTSMFATRLYCAVLGIELFGGRQGRYIATRQKHAAVAQHRHLRIPRVMVTVEGRGNSNRGSRIT
jgi:hypothetical protein